MIDRTVVFAPNVIFQSIDGEGLLLGLDDEVVFALNASGARIAQLVAESRTVSAIVEIISAEYGGPRDEIAADVLQLLDTLEARGLVVVAAEGGR